MLVYRALTLTHEFLGSFTRLSGCFHQWVDFEYNIPWTINPTNSSQVTAIPKYSSEDTVLSASNTAGDKITVPVPQGTAVTIDTPGLHYNRMSAGFRLERRPNDARSK